jgi:hypothetical protein
MSKKRLDSRYLGSMPGDLNYAHEKYSRAVSIMATSDGSLRDRLYDAYLSQAMNAHPPRPGLGPPMSEELAEEIVALHQRLTAEAAVADEGRLLATIRSLSDDEVREAAEELVGIEWAISRELRDRG